MTKKKAFLSLSGFEIWIPGVLVGVGDQFFKVVVTADIPLLKRVPILGQDFLALTRVFNRGLMNDHLSDMPSGMIENYTRVIPSLIWAALLGLCVFQFNSSGRIRRTAMIGLLAGGASNLFDHFRIAHTIDTFQIFWTKAEHIPFNLADIGIFGGGSVWAVTILLELINDFKKPISNRK